MLSNGNDRTKVDESHVSFLVQLTLVFVVVHISEMASLLSTLMRVVTLRFSKVNRCFSLVSVTVGPDHWVERAICRIFSAILSYTQEFRSLLR